jgi:hypothetical protein
MPRVLALFLATAAATVAAGCTGRDAQEAQQLVAESQAAFASVRSATFTARLTMTGGPEELTLSMSGGGYGAASGRATSTWSPRPTTCPSMSWR